MAIFACLTVQLAGVLLDQTRILYNPEIILNKITPLSWVFYDAYLLFCLLQIAGEIRWRRIAAPPH